MSLRIRSTPQVSVPVDRSTVELCCQTFLAVSETDFQVSFGTFGTVNDSLGLVLLCPMLICFRPSACLESPPFLRRRESSASFGSLNQQINSQQHATPGSQHSRGRRSEAVGIRNRRWPEVVGTQRSRRPFGNPPPPTQPLTSARTSLPESQFLQTTSER